MNKWHTNRMHSAVGHIRESFLPGSLRPVGACKHIVLLRECVRRGVLQASLLQVRERVANALYIAQWHKHWVQQRPIFKMIADLKRRLKKCNNRLKNQRLEAPKVHKYVFPCMGDTMLERGVGFMQTWHIVHLLNCVCYRFCRTNNEVRRLIVLTPHWEVRHDFARRARRSKTYVLSGGHHPHPISHVVSAPLHDP